ncbi:MAG TPA: ATP-binding protein [Candidatus Acidoferrum sp.]|nr:ATP-binding protein [Candidatus Acidoferrum sp.]
MEPRPSRSVDVAELQGRLKNSGERIAELEARLAEAEETLQAIRTGQVDALVVSGPDGDQIFALEGADHAYRILVEEMQEGAVTLDPDGLILYANRQFAAMMKTPVESIVGCNIRHFLAPDRYPMFSRMLANNKSEHQRTELMLRASDGTSIPVQVSLIWLNTAGIQTVCVVISDLTEQRHYEAMVEEGELSRLILEQAAEAIVVIDARGMILRSSESAQNLAGRNILLQPFDSVFQLWERETRIDTARLLSVALAGEGFQSIEVSLFHADKPYSTLLLSAGPLWGDDRELLGCVVTLTDITERKRSEEALVRQAQELERSNGDLRQFAYAVSHDLREPIRIVTIYSQLFEKKYKGSLDEQADAFIQHTIEAAQRVETLLDDLLAYTQTAEGPQSVDSAVDANVCLAKVLAMFDAALVDSGAIVTSDPLPLLRVKEVHIQQLLQNLISNSLKYRSEESPRIHISAQRDRGMWKIGIADNGIGIDAQYHEQVFGLFKRLHGSGKYAGSGIGLAICHKIVERYGGRMWVESEAGKGSKFFFTLPGE